MEIEELMINLKIIEKLEIHQKLITRDTYLNIERTSIIPEWMRRWNRQDNRHETIKKINAVVNDTIFLLSKNATLCDQYKLKDALLACIKGLNNLKETYVICNQTYSRIELIIEKIKGAVLNNPLEALPHELVC